MARHSSAVAAAELLVGRSRRELRDSLRRLHTAFPALPLLAAVGIAGALAGLWLMHRRAQR